jgi:hypothetical protein
MNANPVRRRMLKTTGMSLAAIPLGVFARSACAQTNAAVRAELKYKDSPDGDKRCTTCLEFLPGKTDKDPGACKLIPGDDEISADGSCIRWNTL